MNVQNLRELFIKEKTSSTLVKCFVEYLHKLRETDKITIDCNLTEEIQNLIQFQVL